MHLKKRWINRQTYEYFAVKWRKARGKFTRARGMGGLLGGQLDETELRFRVTLSVEGKGDDVRLDLPDVESVVYEFDRLELVRADGSTLDLLACEVKNTNAVERTGASIRVVASDPYLVFALGDPTEFGSVVLEGRAR